MKFMPMRSRLVLIAAICLAAASAAEQRTQHFDQNPNWEGLNNRSTAKGLATVVQDFGYTATAHNGMSPGEVGGSIMPDGMAAYYAKEIPVRTLEDNLSASGTVVVEKGGGNTLLGFFNHNTINEWRTPNSLVFRINGRGDFFHVHFEYATSRWRAGAGVIGRVDLAADRVYPLEIPSQGVHTWSLEYDKDGNNGAGSIKATFDGVSAVCNLDPDLRTDGATFDRFGLLNVVKSVDSKGDIWIDDVVINGRPESFDSDPQWEGYRNRITYESEEVRPRFNFGYSATTYTGGAVPGEIGGLFFRGDCRYPQCLAYYGDRLGTLTLAKPLRASGKIVLLRAVSDSTTLFGFFNAQRSVQVNESQASATPKDFLGIAVEGPSREGFYVYPVYRVHDGEEANGCGEKAPHILPDGLVHEWTLEYVPGGGDTEGKITLSLDGKSVDLPFPRERQAAGAQFDRFGFVTPWIDGNGQRIYFDDLEYTCRQ